MSAFRLFCFKQFFKVHIFCLMMMVVFRLFMNTSFGLLLWIALIASTFCSGVYLSHKPYMVTKDMYATVAIAACISLSIIAQRFLWIALRIDLLNMMYFLLSMLIFATLVAYGMRVKDKKKRWRKPKKVDWFLVFRYAGWGFLLFLFFYQLVLSYLLRPNFLTVMALTISHGNLLLLIWTYFDVKQMYAKKRYRRKF